MTDNIEHSEFCNELDKRLDEVIAWAVLACPLKEVNLAYADFEKIRFDFQQIALGKVKNHHREKPEPEDGGPQYINDNPAPWP
ncbi:MAG TPA: hypothetical protein VL995_02655 [Cellvibrio sp.]|nr:hypothetical protein [Cellvibrio sp.]